MRVSAMVLLCFVLQGCLPLVAVTITGGTFVVVNQQGGGVDF